MKVRIVLTIGYLPNTDWLYMCYKDIEIESVTNVPRIDVGGYAFDVTRFMYDVDNEYYAIHCDVPRERNVATDKKLHENLIKKSGFIDCTHDAGAPDNWGEIAA